MLDPAILLSKQNHCTGTTTCYPHPVKPIVYTDGIKMLAEDAHCDWLIDAIASHQSFLTRRYPTTCDRQTWTLTVHPANMASLVCTLHNTGQAIRQEILWIDFPLSAVTLYCFDHILHLASETKI